MVPHDHDKPAPPHERLNVQNGHDFVKNLTMDECHALLAITSIGVRIKTIIGLLIVSLGLPCLTAFVTAKIRVAHPDVANSVAALSIIALITFVLYGAYLTDTMLRDKRRLVALGFPGHQVQGLIRLMTFNRTIKHAFVEVCEARISDNADPR